MPTLRERQSMNCRIFRPIFLVLLVYLGLPVTVLGQTNDEADRVGTEQQAPARFDQRTPLTTVQGFMRAAELGDYKLASTYLDLRYLPEGPSDLDGTQLAEQLYIVIARKLRVDFSALSNDAEGLADDNLPGDRDELGKIPTPRGPIALYLQRVPGENGSGVWRISSATVAQVPDLYGQFGYSPLVEAVRQVIPTGSFLGAELFKWVFAIIAATGAALAWLALAWLASHALTRNRIASRKRLRIDGCGPSSSATASAKPQWPWPTRMCAPPGRCSPRTLNTNVIR